MAKTTKKPDNRAESEAVEDEVPLSRPDSNLVVWTKSREESDRLVAEAESLCWANRFDEAIAFCGRAIALADENAYAYAVRADALRLADRPDEALADCNHAIKIAPDYGPSYTVRATIHREAGRFDEALADCNRAITIKPSFVYGYAVRAETHRLAGRLNEALADCETALKLKSDYGYALESRRLILISIGERNKKDYHSRHMDTAALIKTAAELLTAVYPAEDVGKALEDLAAKVAREATARERSAAPAVPAASAAEGLQWPSNKWKNAPEKVLGKKFGIIKFLRREWEPFIQKTGQVVTRALLAMHDSDAEQALSRHLEKHEFPRDISIIYPKELAKLIHERPEIVRAVLGEKRIADLRN